MHQPIIQVATSATDYWLNKIRRKFNRLTTTAQTVANVQIEVEKFLLSPFSNFMSRDIPKDVNAEPADATLHFLSQ